MPGDVTSTLHGPVTTERRTVTAEARHVTGAAAVAESADLESQGALDHTEKMVVYVCMFVCVRVYVCVCVCV